MSTKNENTTPTTTANITEPKMGILDRAAAWGRSHPIGTTFGAVVAGNLAYEGGKKAASFIKDRFTDKAAEPAKEQAASFASGFVKKAVGRLGKW